MESMHSPVTKSSSYHTERLHVLPWKEYANSSEKVHAFAELVTEILSPEVTKDLPSGWQQIITAADARQWVEERDEESSLLLIQDQSSQAIIGLMFLYESESKDLSIEVRLGYLIAQKHWGKGYATELIQGLVHWCKSIEKIKSISGGVESGNIGSIKVLERNGFKCISDANDPTLFFVYHFQRGD